MRPFTIREEDGSAIAAVCDICGGEIYEGSGILCGICEKERRI